MTSFIFIRHGQSQANKDNYVADASPKLTKEGEMQARKAAHVLKGRGIKVVATSPFVRSQQTADIIAKKLRVKDIEVIDDLRERGLGHYEGHPREHESYYYFTVEGKEDVEPVGFLIARCEAALNKIKKLSERGTVLVVGHAVEGYFLRQVAAGKRLVSEFDPPKEIKNGEFSEIEILPPISPPFTKQSALTLGSLIVGFVLLLAGLFMLFIQPAKQPSTEATKEPIPISTGLTDAELQGAAKQSLQDQSGTEQSSSDISNQLQPVSSGIPQNWQ